MLLGSCCWLGRFLAELLTMESGYKRACLAPICAKQDKEAKRRQSRAHLQLDKELQMPSFASRRACDTCGSQAAGAELLLLFICAPS